MGVWMMIASGVLLAGLLWLEYRRSNRSWLWLRVLAVVTAVAALVMMVFPPQYTATVTRSAHAKVLLTNGYNADTLKHFLNTHDYTDSLYGYGLREQFVLGRRVVPVTDVRWLAHDSLATIHIIGHGLPPYQLQALQSASIVFHSAAPATGVQSLYWPQQVMLGQPFTVQGTVHNTGNTAVQLMLTGFGVGDDTMQVPANAQKTFSLKAMPPQVGSAAYRLVLLRGTDTLANDPLPVTVLPAKQLKILAITSAPGFELKFLKNWLSQHGYGLTLRTAISKDKYGWQYINMPQQAVNSFTAAALQRFDVVLADAGALSAMPSAQKNALEGAVANDGLGLLVLADSTLQQQTIGNRRWPVRSLALAAKQVQPVLADSTRLPVIEVDEPMHITPANGMVQTVAHAGGQWLAATSQQGLGRVVVVALPQTWRWAVAGQQQAYSKLWSTLLTTAARPAVPAEHWVADALPAIHQPTALQAYNVERFGPATIGGTTIAMQQPAQAGQPLTGTWWPQQSGWTDVVHTNGRLSGLYVYEPQHHAGVRAWQAQQATSQYALEHSPSADGTLTATTTRPVEPVWFIVLLLASLAVLWVEKKFL